MERTTDRGRETSPDGGRTWLLVEPSAAWLDRPTPTPGPDPAAAVLDAIDTARTAVSSMSPTGGTRRAVEALCDATAALITPPTEET